MAVSGRCVQLSGQGSHCLCPPTPLHHDRTCVNSANTCRHSRCCHAQDGLLVCPFSVRLCWQAPCPNPASSSAQGPLVSPHGWSVVLGRVSELAAGTAGTQALLMPGEEAVLDPAPRTGPDAGRGSDACAHRRLLHSPMAVPPAPRLASRYLEQMTHRQVSCGSKIRA